MTEVCVLCYSQSVINLLLTGTAVTNVWDNDKDVSGLSRCYSSHLYDIQCSCFTILHIQGCQSSAEPRKSVFLHQNIDSSDSSESEEIISDSIGVVKTPYRQW